MRSQRTEFGASEKQVLEMPVHSELNLIYPFCFVMCVFLVVYDNRFKYLQGLSLLNLLKLPFGNAATYMIFGCLFVYIVEIMKISKWQVLFLIWSIITIVQPQRLIAQISPSSQINSPIKPFTFPLQLEMRVPFDPTAFPSDSKSYLIYELYLTNFSSAPINLQRIKLMDADRKNTRAVATFEAAQLQIMLQPLGRNTAGLAENLRLKGGESAIVFMEVITDRKKPFPNKLIHRVITETDSLDGVEISTRNSTLQSFAPPVRGANWTAADGPGNDVDNHHRRGTIILEGRAVDSRRYAIDWKKLKDGVSFSGDPRDVQSYFCYGEKVFAVADGRVVGVKDSLPNNVPGHGKAFHPAVPLTFEMLAGNNIIIDLGNGHFAYYMHLQPGSLQVKPGDRVHKGQLLGRIGASGDAREPHLHFEVTTSSKLLLGEGLPYLIDQYRLNLKKDGSTNIHKQELPIDKEIIDFGQQNVKK